MLQHLRGLIITQRTTQDDQNLDQDLDLIEVHQHVEVSQTTEENSCVVHAAETPSLVLEAQEAIEV